MPVSRALIRLLRIRDLEEEQLRLALESAMGNVHTLQDALSRTNEREQTGRSLVGASARTGEVLDRQAGMLESEGARRRAAALIPRIENAQALAAEFREAFLEKRVERKQAETLIESSKAQDALEAARKSQDALDDWYRARLYRTELGQETAKESAPNRELGF